jgi:soluble lytic murein transglycosylase
MRVRMCGGAVLLGALGLTSVASADIYLHRDRFGVLHFTNAPAEGNARIVLKERPLPPARRMLVPYRSAPLPPRAVSRGGVVGGSSSYDALIREVADRYDVEYALVKAVIKAESAFDRLAVSPKGALGLMQLMPATAAQHKVRNAFLPRDNIEGGVRHLRMLLDRYNGSVTLAVAAYNAGTQRVEDAGGVPSIPETREYLARVLRYRLAYLREGEGVLQVRR